MIALFIWTLDTVIEAIVLGIASLIVFAILLLALFEVIKLKIKDWRNRK
jgi:hypothetical protein